MKKVFKGQFYTEVKISSDEFYKLGGFSNPDLFRNSQGHFKRVETAEYKAFKKEIKHEKAK